MRIKTIILRSFSILLSILFLLPSAVFAGPKFYDDDPVWKEADTQDASKVEEREIDLIYDLAENMFYKPGDKAQNVRAQNINTVDEVPDSSWFTNRSGLTAQDVAKGPNKTEGPASGQWTIIAAKNDGVSPGFTIKDANGNVWFIKPDPPDYPGMATGTEVAATKLFWALGFHVPEDHIAHMKIEDLIIGEGTKVKTPSGKRRSMKESDVKNMLRRGHQDADGSYRVHASLKLEGTTVGGFRFYGTRSDDPNDVVLHEHRRELRGYYVFAAWLNHVDCKALQSMDTVVSENGKAYVRHHLLDFSSALGSGSIYPHAYWEGYENLFEKGSDIGKDMISVGFRVEPWRTQPFYQAKSIGRFPDKNNEWDPETWQPRVTNSAFLHARPDDKFWAARKVMGISNEMIKAAIQSGEFNDQQSEDFLVQALIERRDAIGRRYLPAVNPIVDPALDGSGTLTFQNAAVAAGVASGPEGYQAVWYKFDNNSGESQKIGGTVSTSTQMSAPSGLPSDAGAYLRVEISANKADQPTWQQPVNAYFKRSAEGWKLVGFERMQ